MIHEVLYDMHFCWDQPLEAANDQYIRILKNRTKNIASFRWPSEPKQIRQCDLNEVSDSWNMYLHEYVHKYSCKQCYGTVMYISDIIRMT